MKLKDKINGLENFKAIREYLPEDRIKNCHPITHVRTLYERGELSGDVLDLGCGEGNSIDQFAQHAPQLSWHGVDIEGSPEALRRQRGDGNFNLFDGINLPYQDQQFCAVYCNQVLEHVRYPDRLVAEARRVIRPRGYFIGSVSYLEPFHSYSIFNFTPYGIRQVFEEAGFRLLEMRAGVDASHLINRQLLNRSGALRFIWSRNYVHGYTSLLSRLFSLDAREQNFLNLMFAGHITFLARTPPD
jgi:SAM-dependent methyltransferase